MLHHEYENCVERRKSVESRIENRPKGGFRHEASKREQQMVSEQVMQSLSRYTKSHLEHHLSTEQLNSVKTKDVSKWGVQYKDIARDKAQNELAKEKASHRRKADKSIEDFKAEAESETVDNDADWVDFEQQELNMRHKELSKQSFWRAQDKQTLSRVYTAVFPGIADPVKDTKTAYLAVIATYLKENDAVDRINLQAAVGLDGDTSKESVSAIRKQAMLRFFDNSGEEDIASHYLEYSDAPIDVNN